VPIEHVVVLCLANRSFDHMLGFLDHPDPYFGGLLLGGPYDNAGWDGGRRVRATPEAKKVLPFGPDHSHDAVMGQLAVIGSGADRRATNDGFAVSYERKGRGLTPVQLGGALGPVMNWMQSRGETTTPIATGRGSLVMLCQPLSHVPVLSTLALEFAVCDRWFCSVPGETWPNRNFLHAATSDGETAATIRAYTNPTVFELLEAYGATWRIYFGDTPQVWAFPALSDTANRHKNWYPTARFAQHVAAGDLPSYSFIEPNHRPPLHTLDRSALFGASPDVSNSQHPQNNLVSDQAYDSFDSDNDGDFARGEGLIATIYEALRGNPELFSRTMLLITYDDHGGLYDHVPPPVNVPPPGGARRARPFDFTMLGPRVPAVIVSPLINVGTVDHRVHDHASVPATLRALFAPDAAALTRRDAWAQPFFDVAKRQIPRTDLPDLSRFCPVPGETTGTMSETIGDSENTVITSYYYAFIQQSERIRQRLLRIRDLEMSAVTAPTGIQSAMQTSRAFQQAAHRHRHSL
jgi:phospholipase C